MAIRFLLLKECRVLLKGRECPPESLSSVGKGSSTTMMDLPATRPMRVHLLCAHLGQARELGQRIGRCREKGVERTIAASLVREKQEEQSRNGQSRITISSCARRRPRGLGNPRELQAWAANACRLHRLRGGVSQTALDVKGGVQGGFTCCFGCLVAGAALSHPLFPAFNNPFVLLSSWANPDYFFRRAARRHSSAVR